MEKKSDINTWVVNVELSEPGLHDNTADTERLLGVLKKKLHTDFIEIDLSLLKKIPGLLRESQFQVQCILFKDHKKWLLIDIKSTADPSIIGCIAIDLGTTRVVIRLIDLLTGEILDEISFDNPQIEIGPDILERIHYTEKKNGLKRVNQLIIEGLNDYIITICQANQIQTEDIYIISVAGNTAMTHLFMGLNPENIIREPYIPVVNRPGCIRASKLGIHINSFGYTYIFPNIGSYFGGDLISGILYTGMHKNEDTTILVDVGTNAEVVLGNKNWLMACAGAAGPALEGGVTKMGMIAGAGVIDRVAIDPKSRKFIISTIEDQPPKGICGSGLIDLAAQLFLSGMIDIRGKFVPDVCGEYLIEKEGVNGLVLVPSEASATGSDLVITQIDIDSLVRSKAAMFTILMTISKVVGTDLSDLSVFYVAGTFGSFIKPESAISIGMVPDIPVERYQSIGNSSLEGATKILTSIEFIDEIDDIRDSITYMELNVNQEFMNAFSGAKFIPHTNPDFFPSVRVWD